MSKDIINEPIAIKALGWALAQAPAFAGSIVSLAFVGQLTTRGRIMAVVVGALTAMYLAPLVVDIVAIAWAYLPDAFGPLPHTAGDALRFLISLSAMGGLPKLIKWVNGFWGAPLVRFNLIKPKPGGEAGQ